MAGGLISSTASAKSFVNRFVFPMMASANAGSNWGTRAGVVDDYFQSTNSNIAVMQNRHTRADLGDIRQIHSEDELCAIGYRLLRPHSGG